MARGSSSRRATWRVIDKTSMAAATALGPVASAMLWKAMTGRKPPTLDGNPDVDVREAVAWAMIGGALVEVVKVGARHQAAQYWLRSTGEKPPTLMSKQEKKAAKAKAEAAAQRTADEAVAAARRGPARD